MQSPPESEGGDRGLDRGRESGRSTEGLEAGRRRVTLVEMTNASERALAAANLMTQ